MPGIRKRPRPRTEAEKALAKELATHQHFPNLWIHVMDPSEYEAVLRCVDALDFPTELIDTETIHVEADNSDRITMIFKKPEPFEKANYRKWEEIKVAIYNRRKKLKEAEEMRKVFEDLVVARLAIKHKDFKSIEILRSYRQRLKDSPSSNLLRKDINAFDEAIKALEQSGTII